MAALMEETQKTNELLAGLVKNLQNSAAHPKKCNFLPLSLIDSEVTWEVWRGQLRAMLLGCDLLPYLTGEVTEPQDKNSAAWSTWNTERQNIFQLITASITKSVWCRMVKLSWNPEESDPLETYRTLCEALGGESENRNRVRMHEFFHLSPESFDTLDAYFDRVCTLRQELEREGVENHVKTEIYTVLSAIQPMYPRLVDRNMRVLEESAVKGEILEWDVFIKDLTLQCAEQDLE